MAASVSQSSSEVGEGEEVGDGVNDDDANGWQQSKEWGVEFDGEERRRAVMALEL